MTNPDVVAKVSAMVADLAAECGHSAAEIGLDEILPETGKLDSAAIINLITWVEVTFNFEIPVEDIVIEKLGSIRQISAYISEKCCL